MGQHQQIPRYHDINSLSNKALTLYSYVFNILLRHLREKETHNCFKYFPFWIFSVYYLNYFKYAQYKIYLLNNFRYLSQWH